MNIWILGNGFDIHHNLPTNYINFLNTVVFLRDNYNTSIDTVGKVFGNDILLQRDKQIKKSYNKYGRVYDLIPLEQKRIEFLVEKAKSNQWFIYFSKTLNNNIGWIDFEKEVSKVINSFIEFIGSIKHVTGRIQFPHQRLDIKYICESFDFLSKKGLKIYLIVPNHMKCLMNLTPRTNH